MDKKLFHHHTQVRVRNYEIDWQGVVHNAVYIYYFEVGRIDYLNRIGAKVDINTINHESKVVLARNEIDYRSPARYGDTITIYSRISLIKNSSFIFEGILERDATREILAENVAVHVWLNHKTNSPMPVPDEFRKLVQRYEGDSSSIAWPSIIV
ncbi:MAG: thioesterase family protein [Bacteroidota bacterium]